ncbi:UDP-glucose 4-epimerase [Jannaschia seosinensis]|uniref:UDP-glucose 4-epimerase n=1 Tax=Jannaschia seosinensis TaxID=313367 RepID=A0A0M7B8J2_9RHOB|nr:NAD(P)-dependent oxidoreductase [Jannaschia seosinensis]CUH35139.1 UDP-glucose 4-epimerase [Jannaschia seosinensis]
MRIFFTGGAGKAGRHVVPYLVQKGHEVLNADLVALEHEGVENLKVDVAAPGQVFDALTMHRSLGELEDGTGPRGYDAVVHFAALPRILLQPDGETFRINTMGTYRVVEAAAKLGIRKIVIASSETTYGVCFSEGRTDPHYLPVDEEYDVDPMDSYAMSKVCNEVTARSFARRTGADIYALRIGNVIEPHEYGAFATFREDPESRRRNLFNYVDARDLGQIVDRCLRTDGLGFQVFNAANSHNAPDIPAPELCARFFPDVPIKGEMAEDTPLYSNAKAREMLGFRDRYDWREELAKAEERKGQ